MAFLSMLIYLNLFDKIELYFGPVGHTYNGRDATHNIHNNLVGNFESISLPEFFNKFYSSWTREQSRPQPIVVDVQYDWDRHFSHSLRPLSYMNSVRAIKIERGIEGMSKST